MESPGTREKDRPASAPSLCHANLCDLPIAKGDKIATELRIAFNAVRDLDRVGIIIQIDANVRY
jgi:hypothetical protein